MLVYNPHAMHKINLAFISAFSYIFLNLTRKYLKETFISSAVNIT